MRLAHIAIILAAMACALAPLAAACFAGLQDARATCELRFSPATCINEGL